MNWYGDRPHDGFTLLEMIAVVMVLGLTAALVVPHLSLRHSVLETRIAANELAELLRLARGQAIAANRPVSVWFDVTQPAVRIAGGPWQRFPHTTQLSVVAVANDIVGNRLAGVLFQSDGSSSGGVISLADSGRLIEIHVDWLTGRVSVIHAQ